MFRFGPKESSALWILQPAGLGGDLSPNDCYRIGLFFCRTDKWVAPHLIEFVYFFFCYGEVWLLCFPFSLLVLIAASAVLVILILRLIGLTVNDCCEGRLGLKGRMVLERCLTTFDEWAKNAGRLAKCSRKMFETWSRKYETAGTGGGFAGEDFQNTGTFIVVRSSVFAVSSAQKTHLARDVYNAYSSEARRCQGVKKSPKTGISLRSKDIEFVNQILSSAHQELK